MQAEPKVNKRICQGDKVIAISGNYRGIVGTVLSRTAERAIVQGLNVRKRHVKGQGDRKGNIVSIECPIHLSNLRICGENNKPVKLRARINEEGQRQIYYRDGNHQDVVLRSRKK